MDKEFKKLYNLTKRLSQQHHEASWQLDRMIDKYYGFNYSETNDDQIIDTLDYGTSGLNFESFIKLMDEYKEKGYGLNLDE